MSTRIKNTNKGNRHAYARIDVAVHKGYRSLGRDALKHDMFERLLGVVRERASFLRAPRNRGEAWSLQERFVRGLRNLAEERDLFLRRPENWSGGTGAVYRDFASLAEHLLGRYPVPMHLASVWLDDDAPAAARTRRGWYIQVSRGKRFRSLNPPIDMTRRMEHEFLKAPHDYSPEQAMRYAQVLGLGGERELARAITATRVGQCLENDDFWREVIHFLINHEELDLFQVGPIVDCLQALRFTRREVPTRDGVVFLEPPRPKLSMKGRTPESIMRLVREWHGELAKNGPALNRTWAKSKLGSFHYLEKRRSPDADDFGPIVWNIVELLDSEQLFQEGRAMRHCVRSYDLDCVAGRSSIWSLTREEDGMVKRRATVEIDPRIKTIVQVKGISNSRPDVSVTHMVKMWMRREGLRWMGW